LPLAIFLYLSPLPLVSILFPCALWLCWPIILSFICCLWIPCQLQIIYLLFDHLFVSFRFLISYKLIIILMYSLWVFCLVPCPIFCPPGLLANGSCCWVVWGLRSLNAPFPCWFCSSFPIFGSISLPILLYALWIWGVYQFREIDKLHIKSCEHILGVQTQSSDIAVLG
jgi:hypothetical protein